LRLSAYAVQPIEPLNWMRGDANRVNKNRR
jgi:hypothetical protein